jgi:hypothetical protein
MKPRQVRLQLLGREVLGIPLASAVEFEASYLYSAPVKNDPGNEITQDEATARALFDVVPFGASRWGVAAGGSFQLNVWNFDEADVPDIDLYKLTVPVRLTAFPSQRFGGVLTLEPGLHTDFDNVETEDIRLEGSLLGIWIAAPTLQVVAGMAYADDLGKAQVISVFGVVWDASDRLHIEAIFPSLVTTYGFAERWRARAALLAAGGEWDWNLQLQSQQIAIDAQLQAYRAETGIDRQVASASWLSFKIGYEFARELTIKPANGSGPDSKLDLVDSAYFALAFTGKH